MTRVFLGFSTSRIGRAACGFVCALPFFVVLIAADSDDDREIVGKTSISVANDAEPKKQETITVSVSASRNKEAQPDIRMKLEMQEPGALSNEIRVQFPPVVTSGRRLHYKSTIAWDEFHERGYMVIAWNQAGSNSLAALFKPFTVVLPANSKSAPLVQWLIPSGMPGASEYGIRTDIKLGESKVEDVVAIHASATRDQLVLAALGRDELLLGVSTVLIEKAILRNSE